MWLCDMAAMCSGKAAKQPGGDLGGRGRPAARGIYIIWFSCSFCIFTFFLKFLNCNSFSNLQIHFCLSDNSLSIPFIRNAKLDNTINKLYFKRKEAVLCHLSMRISIR